MIDIRKFVGSGFFTGYFPKAPGTFASLIALFIYLIPGFENLYFQLLFIVISIIAGIPIGNYF